MKSVYVVTAGEYDDYHIVGVYDSKEKAEPIAYSKYAEGEHAFVEEWPINQLGSLSRYTENQIQYKYYNPDYSYISGYLTGDQHHELYMDHLHKSLQEQKKEEE